MADAEIISSITLTTNQVIAGAGILVGAIIALFGLLGVLINHVLKGPKEQVALLRSHLATLEKQREDDKRTITALDLRATDLEKRSFTFLETMAARYAATTERLASLSHHTVEALDGLVDAVHRLKATETGVHVTIKGEIERARGHAKHLSGEHRVDQQ